MKIIKNDVGIFLREYTLAIIEAGAGGAADGGSKKLATLLMDNEVRDIFFFKEIFIQFSTLLGRGTFFN